MSSKSEQNESLDIAIRQYALKKFDDGGGSSDSSGGGGSSFHPSNTFQGTAAASIIENASTVDESQTTGSMSKTAPSLEGLLNEAGAGDIFSVTFRSVSENADPIEMMNRIAARFGISGLSEVSQSLRYVQDTSNRSLPSLPTGLNMSKGMTGIADHNSRG